MIDPYWRPFIHEAGHAVAAYLLPNTYLISAEKLETDFGPKETSDLFVLSDIIKTYLAGIAAEKLFFGAAMGGDIDLDKIAKINPGRKSISLELSYITDILQQYKPQMYLVAGDLADNRKVGPDRMDELFINVRRNGFVPR